MKQKVVTGKCDLNVLVVENVLKIMHARGLNKNQLAIKLGYEPAKIGRLLNLQQSLSLDDIENFSKEFLLRPIDLITYPEKYVRDLGDKGPVVSVTIEVTPENRQQLLNFIK